MRGWNIELDVEQIAIVFLVGKKSTGRNHLSGGIGIT